MLDNFFRKYDLYIVHLRLRIMPSPYPSLQTASLPAPILWDLPPSAALHDSLRPLFNPIQSTHPGMLRFSKTNKTGTFLRFDNAWHLESFSSPPPYRSGGFSGQVAEYKDSTRTGVVKDISGFCKILHILDAYRVIQGDYPMAQHPGLPSPGTKSAKLYEKLHDPQNQAYVDSVACYMLSKFREAGHSPHFSLFYGAYLGIAKKYYYNITEEFSHLRSKAWFWRQCKANHFSLVGFEGDTPLPLDNPLLIPPETLSESDSESESESEGNLSEFGDQDGSNVELTSLHSASITTESSSPSSRSSSGSEYSDEIDENITLFAAINEFPTLLMFLETNTATMDSLLYDEDASDQPTYELQWTAWIFQVIAALCQIQSLWAMTHNDLHSNNILWTETTEEFLYYSMADGRKWKVPTFGKLFRIIDFGRAIYTHNDVLCISDDYLSDNEAGSQYNFGPIYDPNYPRIYPNPSFDLCRLSVSILEGIFGVIPEDKENGVVLSSEIDRTQNETVSELYNLLWSWLIDSDGRNVLWNADGSERYPGFDLYTVIAQKVKGAVPREQLDKDIFKQFALLTEAPEQKFYSLFS